MNIEIKNSNYTTQEKLQILADAERKESSAMQRHAAFVIALQQTEDVFLY